MISLLSTMFEYNFMQHAFIAGTIAAILAGIVGYFVIIRNLSFAAHALGHIGFAGASGALLIGLAPITGQFLLTMIAAIGIGAFGNRINKSDMAIGIVLSFCLGLGSLFLHFHQGYAGQATIILFGNLLGVSDQDIQIMFWLMIISLLAMAFISRRLLFASIEPEVAEAKGISLFWIAVFFVLILAIAVTLTSQVVGVILIFTLLVGPAAIAVQWTSHFWTGIIFSTLLAVAIVWAGICLSYFTDWPISFWISAIVFGLYIINTFKNRTALR
ncbi:metal ABC transporter permease [Aquicella lusitana]|uniref:Zinc/manganese transport system permease protein n=1 Tax=Aquicella lusitana TaxID=254246 RepID=A0A370GFK2_9COXI|nr:metal ABC transporter permease [Aquicella lusitana]RDI42592.1 zinc/manganese transport system permease protein [Aquicella lusitana]VVC74370.1 High-affinity zinc uptake system membrane protein ZnuB [Aquicella lusitana]